MASLSQIRRFLSSRGYQVSTFLEKVEFMSAYKQAFILPESNNSSSSCSHHSSCSSSISSDARCSIRGILNNIQHVYTRKIGSLDCIVHANCVKPDVALLVFHGFGANNQDLSFLADAVMPSSPTPSSNIGFCVIFANGCLSLNELLEGTAEPGLEKEGGSRAWWKIDVGHLAMKFMQGQLDEVANNIPVGIESCRSKISTFMDEVKSIYDLDSSRLAMAGFSQGSMLCMDSLFHLKDPNFLYMALFSCGPMCQKSWVDIYANMNDANKSKIKEMSIYQTHGTSDMVIPVIAGRMVKGFINSLGCEKHEYTEFNGPHTLPPNLDHFKNGLVNAFNSRFNKMGSASEPGNL